MGGGSAGGGEPGHHLVAVADKSIGAERGSNEGGKAMATATQAPKLVRVSPQKGNFSALETPKKVIELSQIGNF